MSTDFLRFLRVRGARKCGGKAAEIKYFVYPLLALWKAFMNPALKVRKQIRLMLEANAHLEDLLTEYEQDVAFPLAVADVSFFEYLEKIELYCSINGPQGRR